MWALGSQLRAVYEDMLDDTKQSLVASTLDTTAPETEEEIDDPSPTAQAFEPLRADPLHWVAARLLGMPRTPIFWASLIAREHGVENWKETPPDRDGQLRSALVGLLTDFLGEQGGPVRGG